MTRRQCLKSLVAGGSGLALNAMPVPPRVCGIASNCVPWKGFFGGGVYHVPSGPVLSRPSFSDLNASGGWKSIQHAYDLWGALDPGDVRGQCVSMQIHSLADLAGVHDNWAFLPWHRAFVYFHERILGKLICDPNFRLPFWDWENNPAIPLFMNSSNFFTSANTHFGNGIYSGAVESGTLRTWLSSARFQDFTGDLKAEPKAYQSPHTVVHNSFSSAMSDPTCSAGEIIFYLHHVNMDRFWKYWWDNYVPKGGLFTPPENFLSQPFKFYDENSAEVIVQAHQFIDTDTLGYCYGPTPPPFQDLPVLVPSVSFGPSGGMQPGLSPPRQLGLSTKVTRLGIQPDFSKLPLQVEDIDPAPVDAILDLSSGVNLHQLNKIVLSVGKSQELVGSVVSFGHIHDPAHVPVRLSIRSGQISLLRSGIPAFFNVGELSLGGKITPAIVRSLQFYVPES